MNKSHELPEKYQKYAKYFNMDISKKLSDEEIIEMEYDSDEIADMPQKEFGKTPLLKQVLISIQSALVRSGHMAPSSMDFRSDINIYCPFCESEFIYNIREQDRNEGMKKNIPESCKKCEKELAEGSNLSEKLISDQVRHAAQQYNIDIAGELLELFEQVRARNYRGIKKLRNTRRPIFRKHLRRNTRILFDFGCVGAGNDLWVRLWRLGPRKDVYRNIQSLSLDDPISKIYCSDATDLDDENNCEEVSPYYVPDNTFENCEGARFYSISKEYLSSPEQFRSFLNQDYKFYIKLAKEQEELINGISHSSKGIHLIQGAAGSGKTVCAIEFALHLWRNSEPKKPTLFLVPTQKLSGWCRALFSKKEPGCIYEPDESSSIDFNSIMDTLKSQIVVLTFNEFYNICFAKIKPAIDRNKYMDVEEKIQGLLASKIRKHFNQYIRNMSAQKMHQIILAFIKNRPLVGSRDSLSQYCKEDYELIKQEIRGEYDDVLLDEKTGTKKYYDRLDMVRELHKGKDKLAAYGLKGLTIIADEVQDLVSEEWQLLIDMYNSKSDPSKAKLLMLGDMNQRVTITDFDWGGVKKYLHDKDIVVNHQELKYSYRFTKEICAFAEYFIKELYGEAYQRPGTRWLPMVVDPNHCGYYGGAPFIIVVPPKKIEMLLAAIDNYYSSRDTEELNDAEYEKWPVIANAESGQMLWPNMSDKVKDRVLMLLPTASKGMEFDTVIIVNSVPRKEDDIIDITRYYTSITRACQNLVVFLDEDNYSLLRNQGFERNRPISSLHINPRQKDIDKILQVIGVSRLKANELVSNINEMIDTYDENSDPGKQRLSHIIDQINGFFAKSTSTREAIRLLGALLSKADGAEVKKIIEKTENIALLAAYEKCAENMFISVALWKKTDYFGHASIDVINDLEPITDELEIIRSCALACYDKKVEEIKTKTPIYCKDILDIFIQKSQLDADSQSSTMLLDAMRGPLKDVLFSVNNFNNCLKKGA